MRVEVNGTRLWFDVDGPALVPDGRCLIERPTVLLVHGGPGSYDHSYLKPHFAQLSDQAQVIYLDIRGHGRSSREEPASWSFQACADDIPAFCAAIGINRPIVLGHSMGGIIALLYASRYPGHPAGVILQSTMARFDLARLVDGFRSVAGEEVAGLAKLSYSGDPVTADEWARIFAAFGPQVPDDDELARRTQRLELSAVGMAQLRRLDTVDQLDRITCPTLVCVGQIDPVTPVAAAKEIASALSSGVGQLEVIDGSGHFPWLDRPEIYWPLVRSFLTATVTRTDYSK